MLALFTSTWFLALIGFIYVVICLWLIMVVLMQEGKSGGMAGMDNTSQGPEVLTGSFGSGGTQRGLFKITSWSAAIFFVLALSLTMIGNRREQMGGRLDLDPEGQPAGVPELSDELPPLEEMDFMIDPAEGAPGDDASQERSRPAADPLPADGPPAEAPPVELPPADLPTE